jgi:hypothetical protein
VHLVGFYSILFCCIYINTVIPLTSSANCSFHIYFDLNEYRNNNIRGNLSFCAHIWKVLISLCKCSHDCGLFEEQCLYRVFSAVTVASGDDHYAVQLTVENRVMSERMETFLWDSVMEYYWVSKLTDIWKEHVSENGSISDLLQEVGRSPVSWRLYDRAWKIVFKSRFKPRPKQVGRRMWPNTSTFNLRYPSISFRSSSNCLCIFPHLSMISTLTWSWWHPKTGSRTNFRTLSGYQG